MRNQKNESVTLSEGRKNIRLNYKDLRKAVLVLRAVNHKLRQQIIELLNESEKLPVTEIFVRLRIEQSVASQHLAILRRANVVNTERDGKFIYYSVNEEQIEQINELIASLAK